MLRDKQVMLRVVLQYANEYLGDLHNPVVSWKEFVVNSVCPTI